jgi:hypothetical protein
VLYLLYFGFPSLALFAVMDLGIPPGPWDNSDDDEELNNIDFSKPETFFSTMGLPQPSSFPKPAEVRQQALERSTAILSTWTTLQKILERHEETIRKRWVKKSKAQRKAILLTAWPNMSSTHRPDYQVFRKESPQQRSRGTKYKDAYMWSYVNIEDLVQGKCLLLFLNSRGRYPPSMFAHAEHEAMRFGRVTGAINMPFLNEHTMFLDGQTAETYGRLDAWADNDEALDQMISGHGFHPGQGLTVLEIQQRIYGFLVECCQLILHDTDPSSLTDNKIPVKPEPPLISGDPTEWPTMASIAAEAPYRVPAHLDFGRIKAVIAAKRSAAEDHIWTLREDPGYFSDVLGDWREHRQETLLDTKGQRHPLLTNTKPLLWERVIGNVISDAYGAVVVWDLICNELTKLEVLKEKYATLISPEKKLPPEYMKALLSFKYMLDQASQGPILNLKHGVPASPPLRSLFVREPQVPGSMIIRVQTRSGVQLDPLLWIFQTLWNDHQLFLCGLPNLMDELERLVQSEPAQKERLSAWVARIFSDLGVIARARHELDIYQPWAAGMDHAFTEYEKDIKEEFAVKFAILAEIDREFKDLSLAKVGVPSDGRFHYPSDKRRTQQVTESMRKAEQNLDLFWRTVDQQYKNKTGRTLHEALSHLFLKERHVERTPEWVEPIKEPRKKTESDNSEVDKVLSQLSVAPKEQPLRELSTPKPKTKTKGVAQSTDPSALQNTPRDREELAPQMSDIQPMMTVSKRAFKVFSTIFHTPSQSDQPGEIPWQDFLHAMAAAGFAPSKLYGSIWQFTPTKLDVERSIQFHEPHPRGKIPFRTARCIGRRLSRAYGWHSGMFVLE